MSSINDYRSRCYREYNTTQWQYTHSPKNRKEYDFYSRIFSKRYRKVLPPEKDIRVIDIACGAGHFLYFLKQMGYTGTQGLDFSGEMLDVAGKMGVQNLEQGDFFEYLPLHKGEFDLITANDIFEHLKKDEILKLLDLIREALKPGGMVLISTINAQSLFAAKNLYIDLTHELSFTPVSMAQALRVCKFEHIRVFGEKPVVIDLRSALRNFCWKVIKGIIRIYITVESGTGRGFRKSTDIFEPRMFAVGKKEK